MSQFIEDIKTLKSQFDSQMEEAERRGFKYNLTLFGVDDFLKLNATIPPEMQGEYYSLSPIQLFNSKYHDNLMITFQYILKPVIEELIDQLEKCMTITKNNFQNLINVILYLYLSLVVVFYLFIWRKIERNVGSTIIRAKNILTIIPKDILLGLESVYILFNINYPTKDDSQSQTQNQGQSQSQES